MALAIINAQAPTSEGQASYTQSGFGDDLRAVLLLGARTATLGESSHAGLFAGAATGFGGAISQAAISCVARSDQASEKTASSSGYTDRVLNVLGIGGGEVTCAEIVGAVTDGVELDWTTASNDWHFSALLLGGDVEAASGTAAGSASIGGTTEVTTGFRPDLVIVFSHREAFDAGESSDARFSVGACVRDGESHSQRSCNATWEEVIGFGQPSACHVNHRTDRVLAGCTEDPLGQVELDVTSLDSDGFTVTTRNVAASLPFGYLALQFGDLSGLGAILDQQQVPLATGLDEQDFGERPVAGLGLLHNALAPQLDGQRSGNIAGYLGYSLLSADVDRSYGARVERNVSPSDTGSDVRDLAVSTSWHDADPAGANAATVDSLDADGWTLDWSAVGRAGAELFWVAFVERPLVVRPSPASAAAAAPAGSLGEGAAPGPASSSGAAPAPRLAETARPGPAGVTAAGPAPALSESIAPGAAQASARAPDVAGDSPIGVAPSPAGARAGGPSPGLSERVRPRSAAAAAGAPPPARELGASPAPAAVAAAAPAPGLGEALAPSPAVSGARAPDVAPAESAAPTAAQASAAAPSPSIATAARPEPAAAAARAPSPATGQGVSAAEAVSVELEVGTLAVLQGDRGYAPALEVGALVADELVLGGQVAEELLVDA